MIEDDYEQLIEMITTNHYNVETRAKVLIEQNFDEIVDDLAHFRATKKVRPQLKKALDILVEIEPVYALADVSRIVADIKLERLLNRIGKNNESQ